MDKLILEITSSFVGLNLEDIDSGINLAFERLGLFCGVDRAYLFLYDDNYSIVNNTHEWCGEGISKEIENLQNIRVHEELPWVNNIIMASGIINVQDVTELPDKASLEKKHFQAQNIQSLLVVPVSFGKEVLGFLGFDSVNEKREWKQNETNLLRILANNLGLLLSRKKTEMVLHETRKTMNQVLDNVDSYVFMKDHNFRYTYVNHKICKFFNETPENIIGKKDADLFSPDSAREIMESDFQVIKKGERVQREEVIAGPDGIVRHFLAIKVPIYDEGRDKVGLCGISTDITELKKAEKDLQRNQQLLKQMSRINKVGGWEYFFKTDLHTWTEETYNIHEVDLDFDPNIEKAVNFYSEPSKSVIAKAVQQCIEHGDPYDLELEIITAKNNIKNVRAIGFPDLENDRIYGTFQDITEIKAARDEREKLISQLKEKTIEQERFIYTVSHDLKSPLVTIGGFTDLAINALDSKNSDQAKGHLGTIKLSAKRMRSILNEVLDISKIGFLVNPKENVSLNDLVQEAIQVVSGILKSNNCSIEVETKLPCVTVDRKFFLQVFENLISNACKFSRNAHGGSKISIGVVTKDKELLCYVKDNGIGVEPQYLQRIFNLFEKVDSDNDNTGVGLAIVKRIIQSHNGRIWAESEGLGHGATFYFTLPKS